MLSSPASFEFPEIMNGGSGSNSINHSRTISVSSSITESSPSRGGLRASIIETINAMTKSGSVTKLFITGEITFSYIDDQSNNNGFSSIRERGEGSPSSLRIRINNFGALEKFVPNTSYLRAVVPEGDDNNNNGLFDIDTSLLSLTGGMPVAVIKYQVHVDPESRNSYLPLQIVPQWKCEPDKTSLVITYQINPECKLVTTEANKKLSDISFIIPVDGEVVNVQSKPTGIWNTEKQRMYWQVDDVDLISATTTPTISSPITSDSPTIPVNPGTLSSPSPTSLEQKKIIARFGTNKTSQPAPAAIRFTCKGQLLSNISLEIVNDDRHSELNSNDSNNNSKYSQFQDIECKFVSGKFIASP